MNSTVTASYASFDSTELRPPGARNPFPIYANLARTLSRADPEQQPPDERIARVLGTCAGYAYSDAATVSMMMARLGLRRNRCVMVSQLVDAMFICSNAFVVQSAGNEVVILCYRGTEPTSLINWLTDLTVEPTRILLQKMPAPRRSGEVLVHGGFYRNVRATRWEVGRLLRRALAGQPIDSAKADGVPNPPPKLGPLQALYITGHSLGGAMALLMAVLMYVDPDYADLFALLKGVYTYGQPMIGNSALAKACNDVREIRSRVHRYVYRNDIVPQLPPREAGDFEHFGDELRYGRQWKPSSPTAQTNIPGIASTVGDFIGHEIPGLGWLRSRHSLVDHGPEYYVQALTGPGEVTEFGDENLGTVVHPR